jgi:predicted small lipoprotein YifL
MQVVFRMSAIVAALAVSAATAGVLSGCGQRGPLYLPSTPPLPQRPADLSDIPPSDATSGNANAARASKPKSASITDDSSIPDTSGQPLMLAPETDLNPGAEAPKAASSVK